MYFEALTDYIVHSSCMPDFCYKATNSEVQASIQTPHRTQSNLERDGILRFYSKRVHKLKAITVFRKLVGL